MEKVTSTMQNNVPPGERLRICRKRMNLTQSKLIEKVCALPENNGKERSEKQLSYIEKGKRKLSAEYARLVGKLLGVLPEYLLGEVNYETVEDRLKWNIDTVMTEGESLDVFLKQMLALKGYSLEKTKDSKTGSTIVTLTKDSFITDNDTMPIELPFVEYLKIRREILNYSTYLFDNLIDKHKRKMFNPYPLIQEEQDNG